MNGAPASNTVDGDTLWAPGTVRLGSDSSSEVVLFPAPSADPDDPLNWSKTRKTLNFTLLCFYVLWTFVQIDIGYTAWGPMGEQLGMTDDQLNAGAATNYGGLAIGCIFFMPFVHKYGRRPLYLFSSAVQLASVIWQARVMTVGDLVGSNLISGLGGAISEIILQITVADVFFVHQHGTMTGIYLLFTSTGAFLGPVASGYIADSQGWRWMWWWCVIFLSVNLLLVVFLFEETKYIPKINGRAPQSDEEPSQSYELQSGGEKTSGEVKLVSQFRTDSRNSNEGKPKTYLQRMALITPSPGSVLQHITQPLIVLFTFPAVAYAAITYGSVLSSFAILTSVQATVLVEAPYNFGPSGVGLMNIAPFVGAIFGFIVGGYLNDKSIMWLARKNRGIYEPEMRLWLALPATILLPSGVLIFGVALARGVHWGVLAFGFGLFGFAFVVTGDVALAYVTDCYQDMIGDALVSVVFFRNMVPLIVLFVLTPWQNAMGVQNVHILTAAVTFLILLLPVALLKWGKKARLYTAKRYRNMAMRQPVHRAVG